MNSIARIALTTAKSPCRCTNQKRSSPGVLMCVALEIITRPYITIAAAAPNKGKSIRRKNRFRSAEKIVKNFASKKFVRLAISVDVKIFLQDDYLKIFSREGIFNRRQNLQTLRRVGKLIINGKSKPGRQGRRPPHRRCRIAPSCG